MEHTSALTGQSLMMRFAGEHVGGHNIAQLIVNLNINQLKSGLHIGQLTFGIHTVIQVN